MSHADYLARCQVLGTIGDISPEDHGGGIVVRDESGFRVLYTHGVVQSALETSGSISSKCGALRSLPNETTKNT